MTKYLLNYHGGSAPQSKEEGERVRKAWTDWMGVLGKALVDAGNPTGQSRTIAANGKVTTGGGANPSTGYSILEAKSLEDAVSLSSGCPIFKSGGSVEVAELMQM
jgi:hypothetical protein